MEVMDEGLRMEEILVDEVRVAEKWVVMGEGKDGDGEGKMVIVKWNMVVRKRKMVLGKGRW